MAKILIAMSGGVDSSATAVIMKNEGNDCYGVTMKLHSERDICENGCLTTKDIEDARKVCNMLNIPYDVVNFSQDFEKYVINDFIRSYECGTTPNPCIECNFHLKFDKLYEHGKRNGFDKIATGHYAKTEYSEKYGRIVLKKASDIKKDQSYVLYRLSAKMLENTLFPLGNMTKEQARALASKSGLTVSKKKESQDICFIPDGDYAKFIEEHTGKKYPCGSFVNMQGDVLGTHKGIIRYTIGQRKGLGLALDHSMYVIKKNLEKNEVVLGENEDLFSRELYASDVVLSAVDTIDKPMRVYAKTRYNQLEKSAVATYENGLLHVIFDEGQRAICEGQSVVLYDGDTVIGGGKICSVPK